MPKKVKYLLFFVTVLAGLALIVGNQIWAQSGCDPAGNFGQAVFDDGQIKIIYNSCNGDILKTCFSCADEEPFCNTDIQCGPGYAPGVETVLYLKPTSGSAPRLITNVGPGTGCVCYSSREICVRGKCYTVP